MTYPLQSLVIIAPIFFFILMIGLPIIGIFGGWKRTAYWGGGTFFFFIVGLIIWVTAGSSIFAWLKPIISKLLEQLKPGITVGDGAIKAVAAPIFFIMVMAIAELILLINYYAWFKKVSKIKQDTEVRKAYKIAKKAGKKAPKSPAGWSTIQLTTKGKVINKVCGGVGMTLLMLPTTISFTQALLYLTTSPKTRSSNSFVSRLYDSLQKTGRTFSWMSYYNGDTTGDAYNSVFSLLELNVGDVQYVDEETKEIRDGYIKVTRQADGEYKEEIVKNSTPLDAMIDVVQVGFQDIFKQATTTGKTGQDDQTKEVVKSVNAFATMWNSLMELNRASIGGIFSSTEITEVFKGVIGDLGGTAGIPIEKTALQQFFGDGSTFDELVSNYESGKIVIEGVTYPITILDTIPVNQNTFNNLSESIFNMLDVSSFSESKEDQELLADFKNNKFDTILKLIFDVQ